MTWTYDPAAGSPSARTRQIFALPRASVGVAVGVGEGVAVGVGEGVEVLVGVVVGGIGVGNGVAVGNGVSVGGAGVAGTSGPPQPTARIKTTIAVTTTLLPVDTILLLPRSDVYRPAARSCQRQVDYSVTGPASLAQRKPTLCRV
jgi:hypothetical protein